MIEKSLYDNYEIDFKEDYDTEDDAYYFIFNNKRQLLVDKDYDVKLKNEVSIESDFKLYVGKYKNCPAFVINTNKKDDNFVDLPIVYEHNPDLYQMASRCVLVRDWYKMHQYCGSCGSKTIVDDKDMMLKCPECGQMHYSRIAPAIIVAITNDDKLLMAKHSYHRNHSYALIAGFVEAGESIEEAVYREVKEEVGINIKNMKYMRSQSWPFPNSLMLGFTAEYDSGDIRVDGDEILDAKWFAKDEIPLYDSDISISYWLLENFINTH